MKYLAFWLLIACLLIPASYQAQTQTQTQTQTSEKPPKAFWTVYEEIAPGKRDAYDNIQARYVEIYRRENFPYSWVRQTAAASSGNEAVFSIELDSLSGMEGLYQAFQMIHAGDSGGELLQLDQAGKDIVVSTHETISVFRPDLSLQSNVAAAAYHAGGYVEVITVRVRPDKELKWTSAVAESVAALEKSGVADHYLTYQVTSGEAPGTFLIMRSSKSFEEASTVKDREQAVANALGPDRARKLARVISQTVLKEERAVYSIDPKLSYSRFQTQ